MKPVLLLTIYCCCFYRPGAQVKNTDNWLNDYIASGDKAGVYWLVKIKTNAADFYSDHAGMEITRQLTQFDFIVKVGHEGMKPTHKAVALSTAASNNWKLSPQLLGIILYRTIKDKQDKVFYIQSQDITGLKQTFTQSIPAVIIVGEYDKTLAVRTSYQHMIKILLPDDRIQFIDVAAQQAKEEVNIAAFDYSVNKINLLQHDYPSINGKNTVISIKENKPDTADIDFTGRFISSPGAGNTLSSHATTMATIIAGGGNSFYTARGVAPASRISSSSFAVLLPDNDALYKQYQVAVQNHSYGTGIENFYGADAAAYDASVQNNPALLHVFSGGNAGNQQAADGAYTGISGFANLTGSFKMSKNSISVGSVDSFSAVSPLSSKGPAYDGRVKPELLAFGEDGSSGAAALVSGTALLLQQVYKEANGGLLPDAALVKAVLLNSATDAGSKGIDFSSGYGNLDAYRAATVMKAGQFYTGSVTAGQSQSFTVAVPTGAENLKILLAWTDLPATANAYTAIVNDLDLTVMYNTSGQGWLPWVLNTAAQKDSLQLLPVQKRDSLNTVEQVTIDQPPAGSYTITVNGHSIPAGGQKFFIVYQWDPPALFKWVFPSGNDNLLPGTQPPARWQSNIGGNGLIEFKYAGTGNWQPVANAAPLSAQYYKWVVPDTSAVAMLRMTINGQQYLSDSFSISAPLQTGVGYNCATDALLYWNRSNAANYQVYKLGSQYMEPLARTTDTSFIIDKSSTTAQWFAVAPILAFNKSGVQSIAFNYTSQGVDCYFKNFTADLLAGSTRLNITLGTSYRIARVIIEKADQRGIYKSLQTYLPPIQMQYSTEDHSLTKGVNRYRARIELATGAVVYSNTETVYNLAGNQYLVYPNPVNKPQSIIVLAASLNNQVLQLFDVYGKKIAEKKMKDLSLQIETAALAKGLYFYLILKDGKKESGGKIVVQ
ncbi:MAG: S8 family serine peptidase [Chitinophagaceae bacterium]